MKYICRIGNNAQNDLIIADQTAADFHAHLIMDNDDRVWIKDLSTKYGTRINGKKITKEELNYSDEVRIGFTIIDWIGIRNKWLESGSGYMDANEWSEPLKRENSKEIKSSEVSQQLASEAAKIQKEYNSQEIRSIENFDHDNSERPKLSPINEDIHDSVPLDSSQPNSKIEDESIRSSPTPESSDSPVENSHSEEKIDSFKINAPPRDQFEAEIAEIPSSTIETTIENGLGNIDNIPTELSIVEVSAQPEARDLLDDQRIQAHSDRMSREDDEMLPNIHPTSTGIRFDYRRSGDKNETSNNKAIVRVVASTKVPDYEKPVFSPKPLSHIKLIIGVVALVLAMLLAGWLIASMAGD